MADDAIDLGIDQLLGNDGALFRISRIIFCNKFELDLGATNFHALRVQFLDGQHGAIFVVLAKVSLRAGHWRDVTKFDDQFRLGCRDRGSNGFRLFHLATGGQSEGNYGKLGLHRCFS